VFCLGLPSRHHNHNTCPSPASHFDPGVTGSRLLTPFVHLPCPRPSLVSHSSPGIWITAPDTPGPSAMPPVHPSGHRSSHHVNIGSRHVLRDLCRTSWSPRCAIFTQSASDFGLRSVLAMHNQPLIHALCCTNLQLPTRTSTRTSSSCHVRLLDPPQLCYAHLHTTSIIPLLAFCLLSLSSILFTQLARTCTHSQLEIWWSSLVWSLGISQRPKTRPSGPVRSWDTAETGPPKDQDRGLVLVFEWSWSDRTTDGVKNLNNRY
jgi:hypothetical protein